MSASDDWCADIRNIPSCLCTHSPSLAPMLIILIRQWKIDQYVANNRQEEKYNNRHRLWTNSLPLYPFTGSNPGNFVPCLPENVYDSKVAQKMSWKKQSERIIIYTVNCLMQKNVVHFFFYNYKFNYTLISMGRQKSALPITHSDKSNSDIWCIKLHAPNVTLLGCISKTVACESNHKAMIFRKVLHFVIRQSYLQLW